MRNPNVKNCRSVLKIGESLFTFCASLVQDDRFLIMESAEYKALNIESALHNEQSLKI